MAETVERVNHPLHYGGDVEHETYKCLRAWGLESDAMLWNAAKYISRALRKERTLEDLKKAQWYLARRIEDMEKEAAIRAEVDRSANRVVREMTKVEP